MKKVALDKVQARLPEYVAASEKQPVLIVQNGEPVAMLVGIARNGKRKPAKLRTILRNAWKEYNDQGGIPHDQFWEELAEETGRA